MSGSLEAIKYERGRMQLLDQRKLPLEFTYLDVNNTGDAWWMIRDMVVRGAPAIAVSGCLSLAVELVKGGSGSQFKSNQEARDYVFEKLDHLVTSRPTAVNLADAAKKLKLEVDEKGMVADAPNGSVVDLVVRWCEEYLEEDIAACKAMGEHGSKAMVEAAVKRGRAATGKLKVLTHCNTGSLATAGFGSALGVIRALHATGLLEHAYCTETRPYGQGARLTAFELVYDKLPATLITDSMAAALMQQGDVDAVVVGADRIAANGDTANKIGTYMLAIVAAHHNVPMFTAASTSTMDPTLPHGSLIPIEQRSGEELTHFRGQRVVVEGIGTWNPAFDVAPAAMLEGIITEHGLVPKQLDGSFAVRDFLLQHGLLRGGQPREAGGASLITAPGFKALDETTVREYVADRPLLCSRVGDAGGRDGWDVVEVGDGNINFVYILKGPAGGLCVKQGLPYVRCVGESWPLTQERMRYEADALRAQHRECPQHTPEVYLFDERMSLVAMEYIAEPAVVARTGLVAGAIYPKLASQLAEFMSCTLFNTSLLRLDSREFAKRCARFANTEMCRLTEQVIFTEPYMHAENNRWTSPELDDAVAALRTDTPAKLAAARAKALFMNRREALCHGDLHLGSLMVAADSMAVIDAEFAFYGPIAFDVGKMLGNLLLAFFAADGHAAPGSPRDAQSGWLISCLTDTWTMFRSRFTQLWSHHARQPGDLYHPVLYGSSGSSTLAAAQQDYMDALFQECLLMAGAVMIRRLVGIAHVKEMDAIPERSKRASCERQGLAFGRRLLVEGSSFASIDAVAAAALLHRDASQ